MSNKKTLILEYDDFHWKRPEDCLDTIYKFVEKFPQIKISLFTTPLHSRLGIFEAENWCNKVRELINQNNICLAVHGTYHHQEEFKHKSVGEAVINLKKSEHEFEISRLPFVKVFRGPHWGISQNTYDALKQLNYTHVYTHQDYKQLAESNSDIKNIFYNWNLKDEAPNEDFLIGHGHTHNVCGNGIRETFDRVCKFIDSNDVEFKFVNDV